jgi:hypothetical protein
LFRVKQGDADHLPDLGEAKASAAGGVGGDDEPLDLGKPLCAEVL